MLLLLLLLLLLLIRGADGPRHVGGKRHADVVNFSFATRGVGFRFYLDILTTRHASAVSAGSTAAAAAAPEPPARQGGRSGARGESGTRMRGRNYGAIMRIRMMMVMMMIMRTILQMKGRV